MITFPPSLDCELSRFLLAHYGIPYEERRHVIIFSFFATLWDGGTLHFPLAYNANYSLDTVRKMIDYFDPLCPADRNLLLSGAERTLVESDWTLFNSTLGGATTVFAYYHLLPLRDVMIRPLSDGAPDFEVAAVRWAYPVFAGLLRLLLHLSDSAAAAALQQIRTVAKTVDDRLADGRRYLVGGRFSLSDMAFAVALAPLVLPPNNGAPLPTLAQMPPVMQSLNAELRARPAGQFALRIYRDHRGGTP
ncbi:MAG TPA: glutathione S-transferase C-terminal domain-containing protein [Xanthobacteraceae bacterium]|nr:glutathione S-transferase C-terminal domain-containing protein [Xanthobacteraceae bacterium]